MTPKVYKHKRFLEHQTYVDIDGQNYLVHFKGGVTSPKRINGTFTAKTPEMIKAMDNDPRNGRLWKCIKGEPAKSKTKTSKPKTDSTPEMTEVTGIKTTQEAKEFLLSKVEGLDEASLTNKTAVLQAAKDNGYVFPSM